jgi:DNA-binding Lrp family transcriptional regulator
MYRRYSLDEVRRKIVDVLQNAGTGLSGIELADKTGINRMTITKYLDIMHSLGLIKKKKVGSVNVWFLESGVADIEFPINYTQVQQRLIDNALAGDEEQARRLLTSVLNFDIDQVRMLTDVILPAANTVEELYSRGRLGKTDRTRLSTLISEFIDLVKFNARPAGSKMNAHVLCVAGSANRVQQAKSASVAFQILGWDCRYIGDVEQDIDPFFDIDFQRYISRTWGNRHGMMLVCVFSSSESSLRFLTSTTKSMKGRLKGELRLAVMAPAELQPVAEEHADFFAKDLQSLIDWSERQYATVA